MATRGPRGQYVRPTLALLLLLAPGQGGAQPPAPPGQHLGKVAGPGKQEAARENEVVKSAATYSTYTGQKEGLPGREGKAGLATGLAGLGGGHHRQAGHRPTFQQAAIGGAAR